MMNNLNKLCFFALVLVLSLGMTSAQSIVVGKVYDTSNNILADASITVTCGVNGTLDTTSLFDGTYAVAFGETICTLGDSVKASGTKGTLSDSNSGTLVLCIEGTSCTEGEVIAILNLMLRAPSSGDNNNPGGGGPSHHYYLCGNGICDTGESIATCAKDCKPAVINNQTVINLSQPTQELTPENDGSTGFFSGITGAVIGFAKTGRGIATLIFALVIIIAGIGLMGSKGKTKASSSE